MNDLGIMAALLAGLIGSGHCVAMCGALAAGPALADARPDTAHLGHALARRLQYNAGRILSYTLAGVLAGAAGALAGESLQQLVDILGRALPAGAIVRFLAAAMVVLVGLRLMCEWSWLRWPEKLGARLYSRVAPRLALRLNVSAASSVGRSGGRAAVLRRLSLGALWGWMPCGLSYTMLLAALVSGSPAKGGAVMLAFGLGTLPALLGLGVLAGAWRRLRSPVAASVAGWMLVAFGSYAVSATGETLVTAFTAAPVTLDAVAGDGLVITDAYCALPAAIGP
jgi:sulfite exporter TauE/SafE